MLPQKLFSVHNFNRFHLDIKLTCDAARSLASRALSAQGAEDDVADCVASALVLADADGQPSHGLSRTPSYVEQMLAQKVDGKKLPCVTKKGASSIEIDANGGFAYPALELAVQQLTDLCDTQGGISMAAISGSHHCGVAGHPVEKIARKQYLGLMFANTPKAMHAFGGSKSVFGTNPISFACPRKAADPIVIDLSLSVAARGKIVQAAKQGRAIPDSWGVDPQGQPSTDPDSVLQGSLNAIGGIKGMALAMMVEILAGALANSHFGFQASSFFDGEGGPPRVGQLMLSINPFEFNPDFIDSVEFLIQELAATSSNSFRVPGVRRFQARKQSIASGLTYPESLITQIESFAAA